MTTTEQIDLRDDHAPAGERLTARLAAHDDDDGMVVSLPADSALFKDFHPQVQAIEVWIGFYPVSTDGLIRAENC